MNQRRRTKSSPGGGGVPIESKSAKLHLYSSTILQQVHFDANAPKNSLLDLEKKQSRDSKRAVLTVSSTSSNKTQPKVRNIRLGRP